MHKKILIQISALLLVFSVQAQNTGNSPYSMYGIGDYYRNGFSFARGMGNTAVGMRLSNNINYLNPASYTSQDSMSFLFDMGGSFDHRLLTSSAQNLKTSVINVDYIAGAFPVTKWWSGSFGLVPFSRVGYNITQVDTLRPNGSDTIPTQYNYKGSGGIYQFYIGNAFSFLNHFSVGVNVSYLFGSINENTVINYPSNSDFYKTITQRSYRISNMYYDFGFQYYGKIQEKHKFSVGILFNNLTAVHYKQDYTYYKSYAVNSLSNDTLSYVTGIKGTMKIPRSIGLGVGYSYDDKIIAGLDVYQQTYYKVSYPIHFGIQYTPNPQSIRDYYSHIQFRLGCQYTNSCLVINTNGKNVPINDMRLSAGIGLPFTNSKNEFNLSVEFGQRGTPVDNLIRERYTFVTCSFRFYEFWFFHRKYD